MAVEIRITEDRNGREPVVGNIYKLKSRGDLYLAVRTLQHGTGSARLFCLSTGNVWSYDHSWGINGADLWENLGKPKISRT